MLALVLSGSAAVPFAAAASSGIITSRTALLDLALRFAPSPDVLRAIDGSDAISQGSDGRLTFLLLGSDYRTHKPRSGERTDMIMVLTINMKSGRMAAASIPRDMAYIPLPPRGVKYTGRVNELYRYYLRQTGNRTLALDRVRKAIAFLLSTEIDHVAMIRFGAFDRMMDELGAIRVNNPRAVKDPKLIDSGNPVGVYFPAATDWLLVGSSTGQYPKCSGWWRFGPNKGQPGYECHRALMYARTRKGKGNSDFKRQKRGVDIVMAAIAKAVTLSNGRMDDLAARAQAQGSANFYSSVPMTAANAVELRNLLSKNNGSLYRRIVFTPTRYASRVSGSAKYRINVNAVRNWIKNNFNNT